MAKMKRTADSVHAYRELGKRALSLDLNWENLRFAVVDSESTGFDPRKDRLVSIGGIGVRNGAIELEDQFAIIFPIAYNTSAVMVHGITRETAAGEGIAEPEAMARFLAWLQDAVLVGHHIRHDLALLSQAAERWHGLRLHNVVIDTFEAHEALREAGCHGTGPVQEGSLDAFCRYFGLTPHDRHTALGDAFLTAQVWIRLLRKAAGRGRWNLRDLGAFTERRRIGTFS